jgi:hypothetical protein
MPERMESARKPNIIKEFKAIQQELDDELIDQCVTICTLTGCSEQELASSWESYMVNHGIVSKKPDKKDFENFESFFESEIQLKKRKEREKEKKVPVKRKSNNRSNFSEYVVLQLS